MCVCLGEEEFDLIKWMILNTVQDKAYKQQRASGIGESLGTFTGLVTPYGMKQWKQCTNGEENS